MRIAALDDEPAAEVDAHVAGCPGCAALKRDLEEAREALLALREIGPVDTEVEALRQRVLARAGEPRPARSWRIWTPTLAAVAVAVVLAVWLVPMRHRPQPTPAPVVAKALSAVKPVEVAQTSAPRRRPKRTRPTRRGVEIESVREAKDADGSPVQWVKVRTQDPRVVLYWIVDVKGEEPR